MHLMKNFQKGGGGMGKVLRFVTPNMGSQKKMQKKLRDFNAYFVFFCFVPRWPRGGAWHKGPPKYAPGCACLNGHSILVTA